MTQPTQETLVRIFAAYWGAKVESKEDGMVTMAGCNSNLLIGELPKSQFGYYRYPDCQLLLKSLSKITDEDAIEMEKINRITDYLRSKSYNIGYGEFSPQDLVDLKIVKYDN